MIPCPECPEGVTFPVFVAEGEVVRDYQVYCATATLASTVESGAINVNVTDLTPVVGVQDTYFGEIQDGATFEIPEGWTSYTFSALSSNVSAATMAGASTGPLYPGQSNSRALQNGYTGNAITIASAAEGNTVTYSYTIIVP